MLDLPAEAKEAPHDLFFAVRVAYQTPIGSKLPKAKEAAEALPSTFEDALLFQNTDLFAALDGKGLIAKFRAALEECDSTTALAAKLHDLLRTGNKAEFALDLLFIEDPAALAVPAYIAEALVWLQTQIQQKQRETLVQADNGEKAAK